MIRFLQNAHFPIFLRFGITSGRKLSGWRPGESSRGKVLDRVAEGCGAI